MNSDHKPNGIRPDHSDLVCSVYRSSCLYSCGLLANVSASGMLDFFVVSVIPPVSDWQIVPKTSGSMFGTLVSLYNQWHATFPHSSSQSVMPVTGLVRVEWCTEPLNWWCCWWSWLQEVAYISNTLVFFGFLLVTDAGSVMVSMLHRHAEALGSVQ